MSRRGFTIVELLVAMSAGSILTLAVFSVTITYYGKIMRSNIESRIIVDSQSVLRGMVDELRVASGVRSSNLIADANGPTGGWSTSQANAIIIIAEPATDASGNLIINPATADSYKNEIVYFAEGTNLYKRTLADSSAPGNTAVTTCPTANVTPTCPADRILTTDYDSLSFTFYNQNDSVTTSPDQARSIAILIRMARVSYGGPIAVDNNIRITLRNL